LGLSQSPSFLDWLEPFTYPDGPLNTHGGWHDVGGFTGEWEVATNNVTIGPGNTDAGSFNTRGPRGWNSAAPWSLFWVALPTDAVTNGASFRIDLGDTINNKFISATVDRDVLGLDQQLVSIFTATQSAGPVTVGLSSGFAILQWIQYDGSDLIYFANGIEFARIVGAAFPTIPAKVTISGTAPGGSSLQINSIELHAD
jgi:hypothetical protein